MDMVFVLLFLLVVLMVYFIKRGKARSVDLPGPKGLPILQNIMVFAKVFPANQMLEWKKQYGPVYNLPILGKDLVILADYDSVFEALVTRGRECADRPRTYRDRLLLKNSGISRAEYGPKLLEARKHVQRQVRDYGKGVPKIERIIREVADDMLQEFRETNGQAFDPRKNIVAATQRVMYTLVVGGKPFHQEDRILEVLTKFHDEAPELMGLNAKGLLLDAFPWLRYFRWPVYTALNRMLSLIDEAWMIIRNIAKLDEDNSGLANSLLNDDGLQTWTLLDDNDKQMACVTTFGAGVITTSSSFYALVNILVNHPHIQERILGEVSSRVEEDQPVSLTDRPDMPYTQAVLMELLRYAPAAPLALPHKAMVDTQIQGHAIPKGTPLIAYLWGVHHDEQFWGDPWTFRPERFLDEEQKLVPADHPNRRHLLTFGAGPRRCPGLALAKARLFLWLVDLVRNFHVLPSDPDNLPTCDVRDFYVKAILQIPPFMAKFMPRNKKSFP